MCVLHRGGTLIACLVALMNRAAVGSEESELVGVV